MRGKQLFSSHFFLLCCLWCQEFEHHKHILNINKDHFAHMNNTAERPVAGQRSHPLPPGGHKTNALHRDRMWPGLVCQKDLPEELVWPVAWPKESCLSVYLSQCPTTCPNLCRCNSLAAFLLWLMFQRHFNLIWHLNLLSIFEAKSTLVFVGGSLCCHIPVFLCILNSYFKPIFLSPF